MNPRHPSFVLALSAVAATVAVGSCSKRLPHGGEDPLYPLRGLHAAVPCEGCHGPGTPKELPTACIDCHNQDKPSPDHHPNVNCGNCHTEYGWDVGVGTATGETGLPTIITDTDTQTTTTSTHPPFPPDEPCWDCHEDERKDADHYTDPDPLLWWDCGSCHELDSWADHPIVHPARTPHGTYSAGTPTEPSQWVVACADCHVTSYAESDCSTCHLDIFPHYGDAQEPGSIADASCLVCHEYGDL